MQSLFVLPYPPYARQVSFNSSLIQSTSWTVTATHNYATFIDTRFNYLAFISSPEMIMDYQLISNSQLGNYVATLTTETYNSVNYDSLVVYRTTIQKRGISSQFGVVSFITRYYLQHIDVKLYLTLDVEIVGDGKYDVEVKWKHDTSRLKDLAYNVLFINYGELSQAGGNFFEFGRFDNQVDLGYQRKTMVAGFVGVIMADMYSAGFQLLIASGVNVKLMTTSNKVDYTLTYSYLNMGTDCPADCLSCNAHGECTQCLSTAPTCCPADRSYHPSTGLCQCSPSAIAPLTPSPTNNILCYPISTECHSTCLTCKIDTKCLLCNQLKISSSSPCACTTNETMSRTTKECECRWAEYRLRSGNGTLCQCYDVLLEQQGLYQGNTPGKYMCYYTQNHTVMVDPQSVVKHPRMNLLQFTLEITPPFPEGSQIFSLFDILETIHLSIPRSNYLFHYLYHPNGTMHVNLTYSQFLHALPLHLTINLSTVSSKYQYDIFQFSHPPLHILNVLSPSNMLVTAVYDPFIYDQIDYIPYVLYGLMGVGGLSVVLGLGNKYNLVGYEMVGVLQLGYFALVGAGEYRSPLLVPFKELRYVNGYNVEVEAVVVVVGGGVGMNLWHIGWSPSVVNNANVMLCILLVPLLVAFTCFVISKALPHKQEYLSHFIHQLIGEYLMFCLMYLCYPISFSLGMYLWYLSPSVTWQIINFAIAGSYLLVISLMMVFYVKKDFNYFGEFKYSLSSRRVDEVYYLVPWGERVVVGFVLGVGGAGWVGEVVAGLVLVGGAVVAGVVKPYAEKGSMARVMVNYCVGIGMVGCCVLLNLLGDTDSIIAAYLPDVYLLLLAIPTFLGLAFTLNSIFRRSHRKKEEALQYRAKKQIAQEDKIRKEEINRQLMSTLQQGLAEKSVENFSQRIMYNTVAIKGKKRTVRKESMDERGRAYGEREVGLCPEKVKIVDRMLREGAI